MLKVIGSVTADLPPRKEVNNVEPLFRFVFGISERGLLRADRAVIRSGSASHSEAVWISRVRNLRVEMGEED